MNQAPSDVLMVPSRPLGSKLKVWLKTGMCWFYQHGPRFKEKRFWAVQGLVIAIAVIHDFIEIGGYLPRLGTLYFLPISLFFIPVIYAAVNFGSIGSVFTALWVTLITVPNLVLWHHGLGRWGVAFQLFILVAVAILVGYRVDREREARRRAQAYASNIIRAQEEERRRIAQDLHDDTIQSLILVCRQLDSVRDTGLASTSHANNGLRAAKSTIEQIVTSLRNMARALRPAILDDLGILASVRRMLIEFAERTKIDGQMKVIGENQQLPPDVEVGVFRVAQEALRNVERHAKATKVTVTMVFSDKQVSLDVLDNGVGFEIPTTLDNFAANGKLGIIGMRERVDLLRGKLAIRSSPGKGTCISAFIRLGVVSPQP